MCETLEVSESGYYRYLKNLNRPSKDEALSAAMRQILDQAEYNDNYGAPRMQIALKSLGIYAPMSNNNIVVISPLLRARQLSPRRSDHQPNKASIPQVSTK